MKKIILASILILSAAPASAGESCLNQEEVKILNEIRSRELTERMRNPECARSWGAAACISPFDEAAKQWLERKENGDPKVCDPSRAKKPEEEAKESSQ